MCCFSSLGFAHKCESSAYKCFSGMEEKVLSVTIATCLI